MDSRSRCSFICSIIWRSLDLVVKCMSWIRLKGCWSTLLTGRARDYSDSTYLHACKPGVGGGGKVLMLSDENVVIGSDKGLYAPFIPVVEGNRLYGRGSNDMKGGAAAALMAFHYLKTHEVKLKGDLYFESVVDEEMGGANGTLAARLRGPHADAAIIPEPTNMKVCPSHLGGVTWRIAMAKAAWALAAKSYVIRSTVLVELLVRLNAIMLNSGVIPANTPGPVPGTKPNVVLSFVKAGDFEPGEKADGIPDLFSGDLVGMLSGPIFGRYGAHVRQTNSRSV